MAGAVLFMLQYPHVIRRSLAITYPMVNAMLDTPCMDLGGKISLTNTDFI